MTDEDAIRNAMARYFHLLDDRRFDEWATLLTDDVRITVNGREKWPPTLQVDGQRNQHVAVNTFIEVDGDVASVLTDYFVLVEVGPAGYHRLIVLTMGRYRNRLVRTAEGWRFQEVAMEVLYHDPERA